MSENVALVVGATGISGLNLVDLLVGKNDWKVYGLARNTKALEGMSGVDAIAADLLDLVDLKTKLQDLQISHVFFTSWLRQESEEKNCQVNGQMLENLLNALENAPLKLVSLVTGGKNYFGSFEDSGKFAVITPYREEQERKPGLNFYYTQEDILFAHAARKGFAWTVHRPQTIIGYALGNAMNMGVTLACYATICKETGRPFVFPGSPTIYRGLCDATDARMLAAQIYWAATTPAAHNQAFNINNGDVFRWDWMWQQIADYFQLSVAAYPEKINALEDQMKDARPIWQKIAASHNLKESDINKLVSWWHTDSDLSRPFETITDMSRSRKLGFLDYKKTSDSFTDVFTRLRNEKIIP